ncbi:xylosyltransferase oxt [Penaeus vannamei]
MAVAPARAIFIVSFNIIRVLCRKYGLYIFVGCLIILFQGFSGYYVLRLGSDNTIRDGRGPSLPDKAEVFERAHVHLENRVYLENERGGADSHNKGPPEGGELDSQEVGVEALGVETPCRLQSKEAVSAIKRASTTHCKTLIGNISCQIQAGSFYPRRLQSYCPSNGKMRGKHMGCFIDSRESRILRGHATQLKRNSPSICCDICYQRGYVYAGVQYGKECFCGNEELPVKLKAAESFCNMPCSGDERLKCGDYLHMNVYQTGLAKYVPVALKGPSTANDSAVRIAFILTINGRAVRQLKRMFKALYHKDHYYFIHVDSRQDYLYGEMLKLEQQFDNIQVSRYRLSTIWGGASLLTILLHCMEQVLLIKSWKWDFVINLSESDYPIKTNEELVRFLTSNRERNFLKSHGHDTNKFLQKQGLDRTFIECETHMWRIGERQIPMGVRVDGGSDWLCLNRDFVNYVVNSQDQLVTGLKKVYSYTLLPAESFFHTVLRNSEYCQSFTDNNLHVTNWKRKLGCKCQYKHIVDWCGCSPNDFTPGDWPKLEASVSRNLFFARKFEAVISQAIINQVDGWLYTPYYTSTPGLDSYWENRYHHDDRYTSGSDVALTLYSSVARLSTRTVTQLISSKHSKCSLYATGVLQAHSYHSNDEFKGQLVQYVGNVDGQGTFHLETWVFPHVKYRPLFNQRYERLLSIEVGTDFDVKEQVFRNFGIPFGPNSDVTIVTRWGAGINADGMPEEGIEQPTLVLSDPTASVAAGEEITVDTGEQVVAHTFELRKPLLPGSWMVWVLVDNVIVASHTFLVLPMQFVQGRQISVKEAKTLHKGPSEPYTEEDVSHYSVLLNLGYPGNSSALEVSATHALLYGPQLSKWIDELVTRFYTVQDTCYIQSDHVPECVRAELDPCSKTNWSSFSPDPKSELGSVDPKTGRLTDAYRISDNFR